MKTVIVVLTALFKIWVVMSFFVGFVVGAVLGPAIGGAICGFDEFTKFLMKVKP